VDAETGEEIGCQYLVSTAGLPETKRLSTVPGPAAAFSGQPADQTSGRLSFLESIYLFDKSARQQLPRDRTIIFYNLAENFSYHRPSEAVDLNSGVICFPDNFAGSRQEDVIQMRVTHLANYEKWRQAYNDDDGSRYRAMKTEWAKRSRIPESYRQNCWEL